MVAMGSIPTSGPLAPGGTGGMFDLINQELAALYKRASPKVVINTGLSSANAIVGDVAPNITAYNQIQSVLVRPTASNTGAMNITLNGLAAKSVVNADGAVLVNGDVQADRWFEFVYEEDNDRFIISSGGGIGGGGGGSGFEIDAQGNTAGRSAYDTQPKGFVYYDTEAEFLYQKITGASGDWSAGLVLAQGPTGNTGSTGPTGPGWITPLTTPPTSQGANGDYVVVTAGASKGNVYFKTGGSWVLQFNIMGPTGADSTVPGPTGPRGYGWITPGTGAPDNGIGNDGDYYINTDTSDVYYKDSGSWSLSFNIRGGPGDQGIAGPTGSTGSPEWNFDNSTTDADPGDGDFRLNNGTLSSVTKIWLDNLDAAGTDITGLIATWDDSTTTSNRGTVRIQKVDNSAIWAEFIISGANGSKTGYQELNVTYVDHAGSWTPGDRALVRFTRSGNAGSNGAGSGDVVGPASAADNRIALFDGGTGKLIKASASVVGALAYKTTVATADIADDAVTAAKLEDTTVAASSYGGSGAQVTAFTVDAQGRLTAASVRNLTPANISALALTGGSLSGELNMQDNLLTRPKIKDYSIVQQTITHSSNGVLAIDYEAGQDVIVNLQANITSLSITNAPSSAGGIMTIFWRQDATGGRTVAYTAAIQTPAGAAPKTVSAGANAKDISVMRWDGTTWYLLDGGQAFANHA